MGGVSAGAAFAGRLLQCVELGCVCAVCARGKRWGGGLGMPKNAGKKIWMLTRG